jgi:hypothetical protein
MKRTGNRNPWPALWAMMVVHFSAVAHACATCYGRSDAPMAQGMNFGIFSLLAVVLLIWAGVITFFLFIARRAAKFPIAGTPQEPEPANKAILS